MSQCWDVLIVEDDQLLASALAFAIEAGGYSIKGIADNESDAVAAVLEGGPCIVLMDVNLGYGGSGYSAARSIRTERDDPIIFHTAYGDETFRLQSLALGNVQILQKPVPEEALMDALGAARRQSTR